MSVELVIAFIALGGVVGVMAGLLGIGGGGIMVPLLTSIFIYKGVPKDSVVHLALGTSMACIILTSFSSMKAHHANGAVVWPLAWLAVMLVAGGLTGWYPYPFLDHREEHGAPGVVTSVLGILVFMLALFALARWVDRRARPAPEAWDPYRGGAVQP